MIILFFSDAKAALSLNNTPPHYYSVKYANDYLNNAALPSHPSSANSSNKSHHRTCNEMEHHYNRFVFQHFCSILT